MINLKLFDFSMKLIYQIENVSIYHNYDLIHFIINYVFSKIFLFNFVSFVYLYVVFNKFNYVYWSMQLNYYYSLFHSTIFGIFIAIQGLSIYLIHEIQS